MTAQINDTVFHQKLDYAITAIDGTNLFDPQSHGFTPVAASTACWRGFVASYKTQDGQLFLSKVKLYLSSLETLAAKAGKGGTLFGTKPVYAQHGLNYSDLNELMPFTGGLLLGHDFIRELYVHMGFHPAWKYRDVRELIFENGRLVEEYDRSKDMEDLREYLKQKPLSPTIMEREKVEKWIENTFSRKYIRGL